jgi:hypothetical protein
MLEVKMVYTRDREVPTALPLKRTLLSDATPRTCFLLAPHKYFSVKKEAV